MSGEKEAKASVTGTVTAMNATGLLPWSTYLITVSGYNKKKDSSRVYGKAGNITVSTHIASELSFDEFFYEPVCNEAGHI